MNFNDNEIDGKQKLIDFLFPNIIVNEEKSKEYDDMEKQKYENFLRQKKLKRGLPLAYIDKTFDDFIPSDDKQKMFIQKIKEYCAGIKNHTVNTSLVFSGEYGTGKTLTSCILCNELNGHFVRSSSLLNELLQGRSFTNNETTNDIIKRYGSYSFLVIDEIGRGTKNDNEIDLLFQVINERYENGLPTILVTNLSISDLCQYFGNAFTDRLRTWKVCNFNWKSNR